MGMPYMRLFAKDFLGDAETSMLSNESIGVLVKLWCRICQDDYFIADGPTLSKILGKRADYALRDFEKVAHFFVPYSGSKAPSRPVQGTLEGLFKAPLNPPCLTSARLFAEIQAYESKLEKLRSNGSAGGTARQANARNDVKQMAKPPAPAPAPSKESTPLPPQGKAAILEATFTEVLGLWRQKRQDLLQAPAFQLEYDSGRINRPEVGAVDLARRNFLATAKKQSPRVLRACALIYLDEGPGPKKGYLKKLSNFFGRDMAWQEHLDQALAEIEEHDRALPAGPLLEGMA